MVTKYWLATILLLLSYFSSVVASLPNDSEVNDSEFFYYTSENGEDAASAEVEDDDLLGGYDGFDSTVEGIAESFVHNNSFSSGMLTNDNDQADKLNENGTEITNDDVGQDKFMLPGGLGLRSNQSSENDPEQGRFFNPGMPGYGYNNNFGWGGPWGGSPGNQYGMGGGWPNLGGGGGWPNDYGGGSWQGGGVGYPGGGWPGGGGGGGYPGGGWPQPHPMNPYFNNRPQTPGLNPNYPNRPVMPTYRPPYSGGVSRPKCGIRQVGRKRRHLFYELLGMTGNSFNNNAAARLSSDFHSSSDDTGESRIVGGRVSSINYWPWQVSLRHNEAHTCGGSIINSKTILTAQHCFKFSSRNPNDWTVYAGKSKLALGEPGEIGPIEVAHIILHPAYGRKKRFDSDIAIVRLRTPLRYSSKVFPVCLPSRTSVLREGTECFITGYGETKNTGGRGFLKQAPVPIISSSRCQRMNKHIERELTTNMICAGFPQGGTDTCQGDSGGPLVCRGARNSNVFVLHGVTSFGFGCASKNSPGIYARTSNFVSWIQSTTRRYG